MKGFWILDSGREGKEGAAYEGDDMLPHFSATLCANVVHLKILVPNKDQCRAGESTSSNMTYLRFLLQFSLSGLSNKISRHSGTVTKI